MANKKAEILTMDGQVASPITLATNVLLEDGRTAQDLLDSRDESMFSPTITTSSSISKVGQGDDVDFSENVIDGAYKTCVLKGKTLVNYNAEGNDRNGYACMPSVEGSNLTVNSTVEGKVKSAILKGNTLVNLIQPSGHIYFESTILNKSQDFKSQHIKPNTTYTAFFNFLDPIKTQDKVMIGVVNEYGSAWLSQTPTHQGNDVVCKTNLKFSTNSNANSNCAFRIRYDSLSGGQSETVKNELNLEVVVLEGDYTNVDFPYFEGMQSVKMPVLTTTGKNLFDFSDLESGSLNRTTGESVASTNTRRTKNFIKINDKKSYYFSMPGYIKNNDPRYIVGFYYDKNKKFLEKKLCGDGFDNYLFTSIPSGTQYVKITIEQPWQTNPKDVFEVQFEEGGSTITSYEPYKSNILSTSEDITLRGISDVKDTLDLTTGELTQRIGEIVLDGSEDWVIGRDTTHATNGRVLGFKIQIQNLYTTKWDGTKADTIVCDKLKVTSQFNQFTGEVYNSISQCSPTEIQIMIKAINDSLNDTLNELKRMLSENPVTVIYPANDVIKTVDLSDNHVYSYKDTTHYTCSSEDGSLLPTLAIEEGVKYKAIIKPSTKYSIVFNRTEVASGLTVDLGGATANITSTTLGKNIVQITTPPTLSHNYVIFKGLGNVIKDVQVIEGDVAGDESYFEGMVDVKNPVLTTTGKNLFDKNQLKEPSKWSGIWSEKLNLTDFDLKCGETYYFDVLHRIRWIKGQEVVLEKQPTVKGSYTIPFDYDEVVYDTYIPDMTFEEYKTKLETAYITYGNKSTSYEPYKSNTISTSEVVLRSLPNGVCDTLDLETGEYVQRIGEIVLDGSEEWVVESYLSNDSYIYFKSNDTINITSNVATTTIVDVVVDKLGISSYTKQVTTKTRSYFQAWTSHFIGIERNSLETNDVNGIKRWLSQNPITVQYPLETPIITTIDLRQHPYAYKDGYINLSSNSEKSLTPTIEYSLIANRLGQIQSNQKLVEKQQSQINELESMVITNLVNTQYQQALNEIKLGVK